MRSEAVQVSYSVIIQQITSQELIQNSRSVIQYDFLHNPGSAYFLRTRSPCVLMLSLLEDGPTAAPFYSTSIPMSIDKSPNRECSAQFPFLLIATASSIRFFAMNLQRHFAMEPRILRQINLTDAAFADLGDDAVMSDDRVVDMLLLKLSRCPFGVPGLV
jgi:hypothetical protein